MSINMSGAEPDVQAVDPSLQFSSLISTGASSVQCKQNVPRLGCMPDPTKHRQTLLFGSVMLRKMFLPGSQLLFHAEAGGQRGSRVLRWGTLPASAPASVVLNGTG